MTYSINGTTYINTSGIFTSQVPNTYTVTAKNTAGCISAGTIVTINAQPETPAVANQTITILSGASFTITPTGVPAGTTYTWPDPVTTGVVTGGSAQTSPQTNISGTLTVPSGSGTATYTVTPTSGACIGATFTVTVTVSLTCIPVAVTTQPIDNSMCATSGNVTFTVAAGGTSPFTYQWEYFNAGTWAPVANGTPAGAIYANTTTATLSVTGITTAGSYQYRSSITNCSGNNNIKSDPAGLSVVETPAAPTASNITQPTCAVATGSVLLSGLPSGNWTIYPGAITGTGASTLIPALAVGTYNFVVTNVAGCISPESSTVVINSETGTPQAPATGAVTQPSCSVATGSVILSGLPSGDWSITWTSNPGTVTGTGESTTITGLVAGNYNFTVTNEAGCVSLPSSTVVISAASATPPAPTAGLISHPTCATATGSVILNGLPDGIWTINPGAVTGTGNVTTIIGLTAGNYNFTVTNGAGCVSPASETVVINASLATPAAPVIGTINQPSCTVSTGSIELSGLPAGSWTINPGAIAGTGLTYTISGLSAGSYNYTVTNEAGCVSPVSAAVVINAAPSTPAAPITGNISQPSCTVPTGSAELSGLPAGSWTINPGAIAGTGLTYTVSGLSAGSHNFTVTNAAGCVSPASVTVVINPAAGLPTTPTAGTITHPTCTTPTGSVVLNDLPATGTWTINPGSITGSGTTTTISDLNPGNYNFTVTLTSGCTSLASSTVVINTPAGTPIAPLRGTITQPSSCDATTGSVVLNGLPSTGTWTINPGALTGTGTSTTITSLNPGTYNFTVTSENGCTSPESENVVINPAPEAPAVPIIALTQPNCPAGTGTITVTSPTGAGITYSIDGTNYSNTTGIFSRLSPDTYTVTARSAAGCISTGTIATINTATDLLSMTITTSISSDGAYNISCGGSKTGSVTLTAVNNVGVVNYMWEDGFEGNERTNLSAGTYKIIIIDANNCQADSTVTLTAPDSIKIYFEVVEPICPDATDGSINLIVSGGVPDYTYSWSDNSKVQNLVNIPEGFYKVTVSDLNGCSAKDSVEVKSLNETCLVLPNAISPNGDLINDVWNIGNIELYPQAELKIFNNWGVTVWKSEKGYPNPWDGRSNGTVLPIDSYFYVIDLHNGSRLIAGSVTIIK
jgi:gliding motility-associated-like protein